MDAEVKRKMTNYEFLMSYSPQLSVSQITEISQKNNGFDKHGHNDNA